MGTPCIPPYCFWMLTKGSQRSFLGACNTLHPWPTYSVKQPWGGGPFVLYYRSHKHWLLDFHKNAPPANVSTSASASANCPASSTPTVGQGHRLVSLPIQHALALACLVLGP